MRTGPERRWRMHGRFLCDGLLLRDRLLSDRLLSDTPGLGCAANAVWTRILGYVDVQPSDAECGPKGMTGAPGCHGCVTAFCVTVC